MGIRVSGKNMDLGDVLRGQAESRLNEAIKKYVGAGYSGHVTVAKDGIGFKTEIAVHFDHGPVMHVTGEAPDAYQSLGMAIERMAKQLRRFKRKRERHGGDRGHEDRASASFSAADLEAHADDPEEDVIEHMGSGAAIIAEAVDKAPRLSLLHAVAALEKAGEPFLVFRNLGTERINVLYKRKDGHFGWVDIG